MCQYFIKKLENKLISSQRQKKSTVSNTLRAIGICNQFYEADPQSCKLPRRHNVLAAKFNHRYKLQGNKEESI